MTFAGPLRRAEGGRLLMVLALSLPLLSFDLGRRFLATNDETRFPLLARDVLERGHWLLPQLHGVPHLNKPPMYAWLVALASWPEGAVSQRNAALVSIAAALGVVMATYWIGRRLFSPVVATLAGLIVVTTVGVFSQARIPMPDMALCAAMTAAMAGYVAAQFDGRSSRLVLFYAGVGLAFWIKGPAGLLPIPIVVAETLVTFGWRGPARLVSGPGLALLAILLVPWPAMAAAAGRSEFVSGIVVHDLLLWYLEPHGRTWRLLLEPFNQAFTILLPWSLVLPVIAWQARDLPGERARAVRLVTLWLVLTLALVALSSQQRARYYLPLCPPAALLIAAWCASLKLKRLAIVFGAVWILVATGFVLGQTYAIGRHNAASSLHTVTAKIEAEPAAIYAVDAPELVFAFYLRREVTPLPTYAEFERRTRTDGDAYLLIAPRALPGAPAGLRTLGTDVVNGRVISVGRTGRPS
jgi:4-amino-4-deoxy-L-arabinose transferase-like glycosyltransferase